MPGTLKLNSGGAGNLILTPSGSVGSDVTVTLPAATATLLTNKTAGTVLQVVYGTTPSSYTTSSSSMTATGYGLSITPTSASNKILILMSGDMDTGVANNQAVVSIRRGSTDLSSGSSNSVFSAANRMIGGLSVIFLDSPATTSSTTYNIYFGAGSSSTITWYAGATVTLMEIAV